jgi:lysophospholipase L1-like esterase
MKRYLTLSVLLNVVLVCMGLYAARKVALRHVKPAVIADYMEYRNESYEALDIDSNDVVFVGNSITERFLVNEYFGANFKNRGVAGNRSRHILKRIEKIAEGRPRKIFLMIGINDIKDKRGLDSILLTTDSIIHKVRMKSPGTRILVQSVLPTSRGYDHLNPDIEVYNKKLATFCKEMSLDFVNLHKDFAKGFDSLTYDGLHLNGRGYNHWRDLLRPYLP